MTMAAPARSAAATTSASRTEPPGWMKAETPPARHASTPSAKGKKASDAQTDAACPVRAGLLDRQPGAVDPAHLARAHARPARRP